MTLACRLHHRYRPRWIGTVAVLACHCGRAEVNACLCPDPYCPEHARCVMGHSLIILPDDPAFCPECGHDVMPAGACRVNGGAS